jgi:hypothetical protein
MRGKFILIIVVIVICFINGSHKSGKAETFVVPLEVTGPYPFPGMQVPFSFDLGVNLLAVQQVRFYSKGTITAGIDYGGLPFSWCFEASFHPGSLQWWIAEGPLAGATTWPEPELFEGDAVFGRLFGSETWDFLLDGHAEGWVEFPMVITVPEFPPQQYPSGYLESASIIIEAIVTDSDSDGISDSQDNCRYYPNSSSLGSCTVDVRHTCTDNEDCKPGYCSMNQEDTCPPQGNGIGDA